MLSHYPAIDALLLALLLSHLGVKGADLDCTSDDVVCIDKSPDFVLKWQISEANKTAINIAGKLLFINIAGNWIAMRALPTQPSAPCSKFELTVAPALSLVRQVTELLFAPFTSKYGQHGQS